MSGSELNPPDICEDEDILSKSGPEEPDSNPVQPLNDALSLRENEVELDYEAEEDDQDVSKEIIDDHLPKEQVFNFYYHDILNL